jgi:hypothetical protein
MTRHIAMSFETLSRRAATTGNPSQPGAPLSVPQYYAENVFPLPPRSILAAPIAPLEPLDLAKSRFHETLRFALLLNFSIWGLFALAVWALFFSRF